MKPVNGQNEARMRGEPSQVDMQAEGRWSVSIKGC